MDDYDVLGGYMPSFVQHLKDTAARLGVGIRSPHTHEGSSNAGGAVEVFADAHTSFHWTPSERDAFFRAVSVHSRWRPDLIAACVPTKTEWEVWMYLEALEEGALALARQEEDEDVDMAGSGDEREDVAMQTDESFSDGGPGSGTDEDGDGDGDGDGDVCEPALEVSQAWIDAEERMASWIVEQERLTSDEGKGTVADTDEGDEAPPKRKRGRPRGAVKERAQSRGRAEVVAEGGRDLSCDGHRSPPSKSPPRPARKRSRGCSALPTQRREALMGRLTVPHLLVLDGILREGEEAMKERENSATRATEHGDDEAPHDVEEPRPSNAQVAAESLSDAVIDPVLLALSEPAERRASSQSPLGNCAPSSSLHDAPRRPSLGLNPTFTEPDPPANVDSNLALFSPRSRRRIQKRLYMRRKRASLRENDTAPEGMVDLGIEKLRPGKKAKSESVEGPVISRSVACSEAPSDAERETENTRKKNKGGLTLPYKLKAQFSKLGVDAAYLGREEMDLLNLGALGKLMGICASLAQGEEEEDGSAIVESIDAQLIRHLQGAMVSFVTDIVHRAIVWRERDIRLKQRSQVWRQGDRITVAAVEHAVAAVGARYASHKEYLESLGVVPGEATEDDRDVEAVAEIPRLSPHRDVYTPLIRAPPGWRVGALASLSRTYEREATRTRRGPSADPDETELDETDSEALEAELRADAATDGRDTALARREEARLWEGVIR